MNHDINWQTSEVLKQDFIANSDLENANDWMNSYELRAIDEHNELEDLRIILDHYPYDRIREPFHLFHNRLHHVRYVFGLSVSLNLTKLRKYFDLLFERLFKPRRKAIYYYQLIQILLEQSRLQQKIRSLSPPIKIIPDSLRPIEFIT